MLLKQGDRIPLRIEKLVYEGAGIGYYQGMVIFVPGGVPEDELEVKIIQSKKDYARAHIHRVLKPSPYRVKPLCAQFLRCGGCDWQHISYAIQLESKKELVEEALSRIGKLREVAVRETIGAKHTYYWRNKIIQPLAAIRGVILSGFYREGTHEMVAVSRCCLQYPLGGEIIEEARALLDEYQLPVSRENSKIGYLRYIMVRVGIHSREAMLVFITRNKIKKNWKYQQDLKEISEKLRARIPELVSIYQNINDYPGNVVLGEEMRLLSGKETINEFIGSFRFLISPASFFQVNTEQAEVLYQIIRENAGLTGEEVVIDAYSGTGTIAIYLSCLAKKVYGIEEVSSAVENARRNVLLNRIDNCEFLLGKVEEVLPDLLRQGIKPAVIILDPPRKGCSKEVLQAVLQFHPRRIIYVSCNPSTLARDLGILNAMEYFPLFVQPVDLFPQTYHVECIAVLEKISPEDVSVKN